jgi:hypothetical protein
LVSEPHRHLGPQTSAARAPAALVRSTIQAAIPLAAGPTAAGLVPAPVAALTEGVLYNMFRTTLQIATAALLALAVLGIAPGRGADTLQAQQRRADGGREGEVRKPAAFHGRITAIADDGKTLTLESGLRGEVPKKMTVKLTDKSKVEFGVLLNDLGLKLKVGDIAAVWLQEGSTVTAALVQADRAPDLTGKITAVSADGKGMTLAGPVRNRDEGPTPIDIKLTDATKLAPPRGGVVLKPQVDYQARVWLQVGSKDTAAALLVSPPPPDAYGVLTAISDDGKVLTLESRGRSGEVLKTEVKLAVTTRYEFVGEASQDSKLKVGRTLAVWFQAGSRDTAATVRVDLHRRTPDAAGTITAISQDGKSITLETRKRDPGAELTKTEIKLTDKTELEFAGTDKPEEKKLTVGYIGTVWLQEGSKDTAAVFRATKPPERGRR